MVCGPDVDLQVRSVVYGRRRQALPDSRTSQCRSGFDSISAADVARKL